MSRLEKRFSKEEKLQIVQMSLEDHNTVEQVSSRFGIHATTLYRWRNKHFSYLALNKMKKFMAIEASPVASEPISTHGINLKIEFYKDFDAMEYSKVEYANNTDVVTRLKNTIELIKKVFGQKTSTQINEKIIYFKNSPS